MFLPSLTTTYSLNLNFSLVPWTGTPVLPGRGVTLTSIGGMVSFGPPVGGVVVLAQECEKKAPPNIRAAGTSGMRFFIFIIINLRQLTYSISARLTA